MLNSVLIVAGIILMVLSVVICIKLIKLNMIINLKWAWYVILFLILFFLTGYIMYFFLSTTDTNMPMGMLLIDFILFFGAIFVIAILSISYQLFKALTQRAWEITKINANLTFNTQELQKKQDELKRAQELLNDKNKELVKMLDDFYTMRINIQKDMEAGKVAEENRKIKEKLDAVKGK